MNFGQEYPQNDTVFFSVHHIKGFMISMSYYWCIIKENKLTFDKSHIGK